MGTVNKLTIFKGCNFWTNSLILILKTCLAEIIICSEPVWTCDLKVVGWGNISKCSILLHHTLTYVKGPMDNYDWTV